MKFTLPLPPPLNQCYRIWNNRFLKAQPARDWENEVSWLFKGQKMILGDVDVELHLFLKHDRDIDSSIKLVLDVMQNMGIYKNDKQITNLSVGKYKDKEKPRMIVFVNELHSSEDSLEGK